ncbi:metal/formaldehyde-sensitive transcriptional repressor [Salmonella enterica]|nr:metal/formaldehyde-sensitive transcriptional repressor [Salmonella enterica]
MPHSPEDKKRILTRVRRIRGQVEALERALESGEPCLAILQQIAAVRGASNGLMSEMSEMVEIHLKDELVSGETTPDQRAVRMAEIGHLLRAYLK